MIHLTDQENHTVIDSSTNVKQDDSLLELLHLDRFLLHLQRFLKK